MHIGVYYPSLIQILRRDNSMKHTRKAMSQVTWHLSYYNFGVNAISQTEVFGWRIAFSLRNTNIVLEDGGEKTCAHRMTNNVEND